VSSAGQYVAPLIGEGVLGLLAYLWKTLIDKRFDRQDKQISKLVEKQNQQSVALATLAQAETTSMHTISKHTGELEELDDAIDQLQLATARLQQRTEAHEQWRAEMRDRMGRQP
jgi:septal ring factor EnvC (AmiA/AmiB activator)